MGQNVHRQLENRRIQEVSRDYLEKGFQVIMEPSNDQLPILLKGFTPDLLVTKGGLNIVVEVKTSESIRESAYLKELSMRVEALENWKFELVLTNPRNRQQSGPANFKEYSLNEIESKMSYLSGLTDKSIIEPSFLYAWSLFEASARMILRSEQPDVEVRYSPSVTVKQLFSYGIIGRLDYDWLSRISKLRNYMAHGHKTEEGKIELKDLSKLVRLTQDFVEELKKSG